ncbi:hypothetical protein EON76_01805 [bacterium]|nr:MAG: hypothetical protein EON76_01805 [bacterium]
MNHNLQNPIRPDGYLLEISRRYSTELPSYFLEQSADEQYKSRARALGRTANTLSQSHTVGEFVTPEASLYSIIGKLDTFFEATQTLATFDKNQHEYGLKASYEARTAEKMKIIEFNHTLRDVIDKHPRMSPPELTKFLVQSYSFLHGSQHIDEFAFEAKARVKGMQHELLTEQVIGTIDDPDINYELATPEQELRGADIIAYVGDVELPIDIKASQNLVDAAIQKGRPPHRVMYSGFSSEEAGNRFRIPREEAIARSVPMRRYLLQAAHQEHAMYA